VSERIQELEHENRKLRKINQVLMDRVERSINDSGNAFALFEQNILLQKRVAQRTSELEQAYRRLLELDKMKSAFLSSVTHELRTPLTSVLGFVKLIDKAFGKVFLPLASNEKTEKKGRQIQDNLRIIIHETQRLTRLINDVLDLTRIEAGHVNWRDEEFSLRRLIDLAVNAVMAMFATRPEVNLRLEVCEALPHIHADLDQLEQVLINLLSNACKFTEKGAVTIKAGMASNGDVLITVKDTGQGIPAEDMNRIFESFYQVAPSHSGLRNKPEGTGLGLVISRQIVEHYGGSIRVESEPGKGSAFHVRLPSTIVVQPRPDRKACEPTLEMAAQPEVGSRKPRVLVVDDDPAVCEYIAQLLVRDRIDVLMANNGHQALELARQYKPDLITLDLMMPVMDGQAAMECLREESSLAGVPIVIISALNPGCEVSADANFAKPINDELLVQTVHRLLNLKEPV
jgi:signal transduction histidine kinase